jgi:murein DD-endopeptidase MepM/ murein hydrolase activator NlpD
MKDKFFIITFWTVFGFLALFTYSKTKQTKIRQNIVEDFGNFYLENKLKQEVLFEPIEEEGETLTTTEEIEYVVKKNDTLEGILKSFNFSYQEYSDVLKIINTNFKKTNLYINQKINISYEVVTTYSPHQDDDFFPYYENKIENNIFNFLIFENSKGVIKIFKNKDKIDFKTIPFKQAKRFIFKKVTINSSIYQDGVENKISPTVLDSLIRLYSFDIDFQRDIRDKDNFEVLYEEIYDENTGNKLADGNILYSKMNIRSNSKNLSYYLFNKEYYDNKGVASVKSFLKTPIPGARLSSGFGLRKHPILGFTKLHAGTDFAAPRGTPIFAAAGGVISFAGWNGTIRTGYGIRVVIKHNKTYSTSYSHMSRLSKKARKGNKVKQGEIVGYVGSTGYSTGPHLHYEVIKNGKKINPKHVTSFASKSLKANDLQLFLKEKRRINNLKETL